MSSSAFVREAITHVPHHEIIEYPVHHFDMYHGETRDQVIEAHVQFLKRHLAQED